LDHFVALSVARNFVLAESEPYLFLARELLGILNGTTADGQNTKTRTSYISPVRTRWPTS